MPHLLVPKWLAILVLLVALGLLVHKISEWFESRRKKVFTKNVAAVLENPKDFDFASDKDNDQILSDYVSSVLARFSKSFRYKHTHLNVMLQKSQVSHPGRSTTLSELIEFLRPRRYR